MAELARVGELSWVRGLALSARLLARDWRAGEMRVLAVGLVIAVASLTTVAFFTDRVRQALSQEASQLLGADLVVVSDHPVDAALRDLAVRRGLSAVDAVRFPSMTVAGESTVLTEIKAVGPGYPLKGRIAIRARSNAQPTRPDGIPVPGTVWVDDRLLARLGLGIGDRMSVGERSFRIAAGASGRGASSATSSSISRFDRWAARFRRASRFSEVRCGASFAMAVRCSRPSASMVRRRGCSREARAAAMRR
jgi:putative ABC transport system permease protein